MIWRAHYAGGAMLGRTPGTAGYSTIHDIPPGLMAFEVLEPVHLILEADDRLVCFFRGMLSPDAQNVGGRYFVQPRGGEVYVIEGNSYRILAGWGEGIDGPPVGLTGTM